MQSYSKRFCEHRHQNYDRNTNNIWQVTQQEYRQNVENGVNRFLVLRQVDSGLGKVVACLVCLNLPFVLPNQLKNLIIRKERCQETNSTQKCSQEGLPKCDEWAYRYNPLASYRVQQQSKKKQSTDFISSTYSYWRSTTHVQPSFCGHNCDCVYCDYGEIFARNTPGCGRNAVRLTNKCCQHISSIQWLGD